MKLNAYLLDTYTNEEYLVVQVEETRYFIFEGYKGREVLIKRKEDNFYEFCGKRESNKLKKFQKQIDVKKLFKEQDEDLYSHWQDSHYLAVKIQSEKQQIKAEMKRREKLK